MKATYFATPARFRDWLEINHAKSRELLVGFYKRDSGKASITWPESVDAALCYGWIDGVRKSVDQLRYTIRFSPRKPSSIWSEINVRRVGELEMLGLMRPAGKKAFAARREAKTAVYSYEQRSDPRLDPLHEDRLKGNKKAFEFFQSRPRWYRKAASWWIVSAKKEETRQKRLTILIEDSANGRTIPPLTRPSGKTKGD
jgi:uncharacterized protein YdeI (YjbR/CyaY-like superfamily)